MIALALVSMSVGRPGRACAVTVTEVPQVLAHRAAIVAEGTATADQYTFAITKFWKGTTSATVKLSGIKPTGSSCDTYQPTIPGKPYLLLIDSLEATTSEAVTVFSGAASVHRTEFAPRFTQYLAHPKRVSRRDVLAMLRGWHDGTIADPAFALWLRDTTPVADVDDWATFEEGGHETSLNLNVLRELDFRINQSGVSLAELSCELAVLRSRVIPALLQVLEAQHLTPELIESLDHELHDIENDLCSGDRGA